MTNTDALNVTERLPESSRPAQVPGVLVFIFADLIVFGMLFTGFMVERYHQLALFTQSSQTLSVWLGTLNMLILVTSGLCVVFAVNASRQGSGKQTRGWLLAAFVIGLGFGVCKIVEYQGKLSQGFTMLSNDFYMFYYALTGAHFLHFLGGMGALAFMWFRAFREDNSSNLHGAIVSVGLYWHMVDLLWILIFPLLYLVGLS